MRSTGKLHLGHYEGVLKNMTALQQKYDCFIEVADWHSITTSHDTAGMKNIIFEMVCDWLAAGIDAKKSTIFVQSCVREQCPKAAIGCVECKKILAANLNEKLNSFPLFSIPFHSTLTYSNLPFPAINSFHAFC